MLFLAVALLGGCGGGCSTQVDEVLDIRGASNTPCTLTINKGNNLTFEIAAPNPVVADTSLAPRNPLVQGLNQCAGGQSVGVTSSFAVATRTSTNLCVQVTNWIALINALGTNDCTNVTLTLTCAATTLYDHAAFDACSCQG